MHKLNELIKKYRRSKKSCQIYNEEMGSNPIIIHGSVSPRRINVWNKIQRTLEASPAPAGPQRFDYTVVTWSNYKIKSCLEKSLDRMGVEYVKLGEGIENWRNLYKIPLLIEFLKKCKSKYVIVLDSRDVVVAGSLDIAIERFINMECSVLFNGDAGRWPGVSIQNRMCGAMENDIEESFSGRFRYVNSGGIIGERDATLRVYEMAMKCPGFQFGDDQMMVRWAYPRVPHLMDIDRGCKIFQVYRDKKTSLRIGDNKIIFGREDS